MDSDPKRLLIDRRCWWCLVEGEDVTQIDIQPMFNLSQPVLLTVCTDCKAKGSSWLADDLLAWIRWLREFAAQNPNDLDLQNWTMN
jgi:hypothetical protein